MKKLKRLMKTKGELEKAIHEFEEQYVDYLEMTGEKSPALEDAILQLRRTLHNTKTRILDESEAIKKQESLFLLGYELLAPELASGEYCVEDAYDICLKVYERFLREGEANTSLRDYVTNHKQELIDCYKFVTNPIGLPMG